MKKQKNTKQEDQDAKNGIYSILKVPNFYFPLADIGKKFTVENTYNLPIKDKEVIKRYHDYKKITSKIKGLGPLLFLKEYADIFWHAIKEYGLDKEYKDCWLVPIRLTELGKELEVDIDLLRPVSGNKKKHNKKTR